MINSLLIYLGIFLAGTGIVWALARLIVGYAESSRALIDIPNERSSHDKPTPRGGGLAIVLFFLGAVGVIYGLGILGCSEFMALFGGSVLAAGIGFLDDHHPIAAHRRLMVHILAAIWSLGWIGGFPGFSFGAIDLDLGLFGYPAGVLFLVWMLNLFNFMDGIDGIAGSEGLFVSLAAAVFCYLGGSSSSPDVAVQILVFLAAGCLGFLLWNWPPASLFMGDTGSGFLGFILGSIALMTAHKGILNIWCWLILFGVFIADATVTLLRRVWRGERWYEAHRTHAYQHLSRRFGSHRTVTLSVIAINIVWLLPLAWSASAWPANGFLLCCVALAPLFLLAYRYDAGMV
jgi:Fuc2NAc and GlcNAc transferase